jgi:spermidine synthase
MTVSIDVSEEDGVRYLHFGSSWIQGAMRIARPNTLELEYTREMMFPLLLRGGAGWPRTVLSIGLGAASLVRFLAKHRPRAAHLVVELEPAVIAAARHHFKLPAEGPRLRITIGDGSDYLQSADRDFDLILVDGYDAKGRPGMLDMLPFYCNAQAHLTARGVLAANVLTRNHGYRGSLERAQAAFGGRAIALPRCESGNVVLVAAAGDAIEIEAAELTKRARRLRQDTRLDLVSTVAAYVSGTGAEVPFKL